MNLHLYIYEWLGLLACGPRGKITDKAIQKDFTISCNILVTIIHKRFKYKIKKKIRKRKLEMFLHIKENLFKIPAIQPLFIWNVLNLH